jgi:hypothetical protein
VIPLKAFYLLLATVALALGCATEEDRRAWEEAMKDARGENMQMRNDFSSPAAAPRRPPRVSDDD